MQRVLYASLQSLQEEPYILASESCIRIGQYKLGRQESIHSRFENFRIRRWDLVLRDEKVKESPLSTFRERNQGMSARTNQTPKHIRLL